MELSELNKKVFDLGNRLADVQNELNDCTKASKMSFSFHSNWRDKQSIMKRIPVLEQEANKLKKEHDLLKSERDVEAKKVEYEKAVEAKKAEMETKKAEEEAKFSIDNPISLLDV